ncbi:nucleolar protein 14 homolog [Microplitis mediator]|uniref:nucleolar protein 14 homolog n=1 Tax=Microplitis mediator TaxID=375433 RepID=UPI0025558F3D|nr:nucleolar protein 14 homolog [Microplitis mediator]
MAKTKNKKKSLAESASKKKTMDTKKKVNPFEVHFNKDKHKVLGKKSKSDRGLPGVARSKAINKRKHTLLPEFTQKDKLNFFMDRRIGEHNRGMTQEEKSMARFAAEKIKSHKQDIFNLNDDEVLTHKGQTLEEIEKFEDPRSDDEFDDEDGRNANGYLDKKFVAEAHFGGGILSKSEGAASRSDLLNQLIYESKKRKAEKQKISEQNRSKTEELDSQWKDLLPILSASKRTDESVVKPKADDFDRTVQELKFESRGNPSDRLKSDDEVAKEEREKLEALERDRLKRMQGFVDDETVSKNYKSVDDNDDGFEIEDVTTDMLAYDANAQIIGSFLKYDAEDSKKDEGVDKEVGGDDDEEDSEVDADADEENEDEDDDENSDDDLSDLKASDSSSDENEEEEADKDKEEEDDGDDDDDKDEKEIPESKSKKSEKKLLSKSSSKMEKITKLNGEAKEQSSKEVNNDISKKKITNEGSKREEMIEKARQELPYTYKAPESYEELKELLRTQSPDHQSIILERIIKCNHVSLGEGNREKLANVFQYSLQYLMDIARVDKTEDVAHCFQICDRLVPHLYDLAQFNSQNAGACVKVVLKEKFEEFKLKQKIYPRLDTLILFKLISLLFSTSDFHHAIVTPCFLFMSEILSRCRVKTAMDISKGLFVVTLLLEFTLLSKRFLPAAINFLRGMVFLATTKSLSIPKIFSPFKQTGDLSNLLVLDQSQRHLKLNINNVRMKIGDLAIQEFNDDFRVRVFVTAINLISEFKSQLEEIDIAYIIFKPIIELFEIKTNPWENYPKSVRKLVENLTDDLKSLGNKKLEYLVFEKKRPKPFKFLEPLVSSVYDVKKFKAKSSREDKAELEKLAMKLKKEKKGAIREIRRDAAFLAKVQIKQQIKGDEERKRKVREIYGDAAVQQGELNKIQRKK